MTCCGARASRRTIRNEHLSGAGGDVVAEEMPAVWVADEDVSRALFILGEYLRDDDAALALDEMDAEVTSDAEGSDAQAAMIELRDLLRPFV